MEITTKNAKITTFENGDFKVEIIGYSIEKSKELSYGGKLYFKGKFMKVLPAFALIGSKDYDKLLEYAEYLVNNLFATDNDRYLMIKYRDGSVSQYRDNKEIKFN